MMDIEIWKDIKGYGGLYQVSSIGNVRSFNRLNGKVMKHSNSFGYRQLNLHKDGMHKAIQVHRLVAEAFITNYEDKPHVNHINGIRSDNRISNLEWCTQGENVKHAWDMGFQKMTSKKLIAACKNIIGAPICKLVLNTETGIYYDSAKEAFESADIKFTLRSLYSKLNGQYSNNTPFVYV